MATENTGVIKAQAAKGLSLDAYCWCVAFASLLKLDPTEIGIEVQNQTVNSQQFAHKCSRHIKNSKDLDRFTKNVYQEDLRKLLELLVLNDKYAYNKDHAEYGRSKYAVKNIKWHTLSKLGTATLGGIFSLGTNTHIWPGAKKEDAMVGSIEAATGLSSAVIRWGLGAGLITGLILTAPWALALYVPFCVFRVFYKEWEPIMDSNYKKHNGEASLALYKMRAVKNTFSKSLDNEYIHTRKMLFNFNTMAEMQIKKTSFLQNTRKTFINMFRTLTAPIKAFAKENQERMALGTAEMRFGMILSRAKLSPVAINGPSIDSKEELMEREIYANCLAFATILAVEPKVIGINEETKKINKSKFVVAIERILKEDKNLTSPLKLLYANDLKLLSDRLDACAEYAANIDNPNFGKSELPLSLIYVKAFFRMFTACISSILTLGTETNHYPGARRYKGRVSELGTGIKLALSSRGFLLGVGVTALSIVYAPPLLAVGAAYCLLRAFFNEGPHIRYKFYKDRYGAAAAAEMRNDRIGKQLSPDLQMNSTKILMTMNKGDWHLPELMHNTFLPVAKMLRKAHDLTKAAHDLTARKIVPESHNNKPTEKPVATEKKTERDDKSVRRSKNKRQQ